MSKSHRMIYVFLLTAICCGCVLSERPKGDTGFSEVLGIGALAGCYRNLGEGGEGVTPQYLSAVLWPEDKLDHQSITAIRVIAEDDTSLRVTSFSAATEVKESLFVEGKDFSLRSGRIPVENENILSLLYPTGNPFLGFGNSHTLLGLDRHGNARLEKRITLVGTAFVVIPVAGHGSDSYLFLRSSELCTGSGEWKQ
jgi:hypothetical protein